MLLVPGPDVSICVVRADDPKEMLPFLLEIIRPGKQMGNKPMRPLTVKPSPVDTLGIGQDTVETVRVVTEEHLVEPNDPSLLP